MEKARPIDGRSKKEVKINDEILKAVLEFWYRRQALCWIWLRAGCRHTLHMFVGKVLPTATAPHQLQSAGSDLRPNAFNMREKCVLHATKTWAMTVVTLNPLWHIDGYVISRQKMKLAQTLVSQRLAPGTWMWCSAPEG